MTDNFDLRKYLTENQLGPFAKANLSESEIVASGPDWIVNIDGEDYQAEYENHDKGDDITLRQVGDSKKTRQGTIKSVSPNADLVIDLIELNDYIEKRRQDNY